MVVYNFKIVLETQSHNAIKTLQFTSIANNYFEAWKEATEYACNMLKEKDKNWYISSITSYV